MDDYSISLGNAVKEARTESKLTQEQIADMLDIDSRTISQIERGLGNPKLETLYPLIRILNVDANTVFYSAPRTETPKLDRLMRLVSTCTEYEAHELIRIVNDSSVVLYPFEAAAARSSPYPFFNSHPHSIFPIQLLSDHAVFQSVHL